MGTDDGCGCDGQLKCTICDGCRTCHSILSILKSVFRQIHIRYAYKLLRCLDVEIRRFLCPQRQHNNNNNNRTNHFIPCACTRGNYYLTHLGWFDGHTLTWLHSISFLLDLGLPSCWLGRITNTPSCCLSLIGEPSPSAISSLFCVCMHVCGQVKEFDVCMYRGAYSVHGQCIHIQCHVWVIT